MASSVELTVLTRTDCLALLAGGVIGRVVFTAAALPSAEPVNYVLDGEEIIFRTANGSKLAGATRHAVVAFQIDEFDPGTRTGWSVLGVGQAYEILDPDRLAELAQRQPDPWAPGHDVHTISIPLRLLSGRRLVVPADSGTLNPPSVSGESIFSGDGISES
jgi:nitroimidazol reductase NimA-like FMN-containing flavoprotein (pyridoxamine 5'-phosphate oxidase superfamily)